MAFDLMCLRMAEEVLMKPRVIIVEDQKKLLSSLRRGLEEEQFIVKTATTGEEGFFLATTEPVDVLVLDWMLPKSDGLTILKKLRAQNFSKPILILTSRDGIQDRVRGLNAGADDYLVKPFAFAELVARLQALLRRKPDDRQTLMRCDTLEIDLLGRRVIRSGEIIELSNREFELLEYLVRNQGTIVTRDMISRDVWKDPDCIMTNVIEVYINCLRNKIERDNEHQIIQTIRGVGYTAGGQK